MGNFSEITTEVTTYVKMLWYYVEIWFACEERESEGKVVPVL